MSGIPTIPAGAQLGGAGTSENHAQLGGAPVAPTIPVAPVVPQAPVAPVAPQVPVGGTPPVPVFNQGTGQWELPQAIQAPTPPSTPLVPTPVPTPENPAVVEKPVEIQKPVPALGATYLETTVNHFSSEIGTAPEALMDSIEKALEHGDAGLINVSNLGELTPEQNQRAVQLAQMVYEQTQQAIQTNQNTVHQAAGGKAQWEAGIAAFNASASEEAKGYVAYLVDQADNAKLAAEYVMKYVSQAGLATQVTQAPINGGVGAPVATGMTVQEYKNGIHEIELMRSARQITQADYDVRMADLDYRRGIGRKQGR